MALNILTDDDAQHFRSSDLLRVGIIGAGRLSSSRIYPCLHMLPIDLVAVCDLDQAKAELNARKFGAGDVFTDYREMLARPDIDAVIICVGPAFHRDLAIAALGAGKHVYTEKPPGVSSMEALQMQQAADRAGRLCMTGFKKRFAPAYQKAKVAALSPTFGTPSLLSIDYCCGPTYSNDPENPTSNFLLDFCIHAIDLSLFLCGPVEEVFARSRDDLAFAVTLGFANGALGSLALSAARDWDVSTEKVELTGAPGQFLSVENSVQLVRYDGRRVDEWHSPTFSTARGDSLIETGFAGELMEFVAAIRESRLPESSISDARETMRLYEAIAEAAATRGVVSLSSESVGMAAQ